METDHEATKRIYHVSEEQIVNQTAKETNNNYNLLHVLAKNLTSEDFSTSKLPTFYTIQGHGPMKVVLN